MGQTLASAQSHQEESPRWLPPRYSLGTTSLAKPTRLKGSRAAVGCAAPSTGAVVGLEAAVHSLYPLWWHDRDVFQVIPGTHERLLADRSPQRSPANGLCLTTPEPGRSRRHLPYLTQRCPRSQAQSLLGWNSSS